MFYLYFGKRRPWPTFIVNCFILLNTCVHQATVHSVFYVKSGNSVSFRRRHDFSYRDEFNKLQVRERQLLHVIYLHFVFSLASLNHAGSCQRWKQATWLSVIPITDRLLLGDCTVNVTACVRWHLHYRCSCEIANLYCACIFWITRYAAWAVQDCVYWRFVRGLTDNCRRTVVTVRYERIQMASALLIRTPQNAECIYLCGKNCVI